MILKKPNTYKGKVENRMELILDSVNTLRRFINANLDGDIKEEIRDILMDIDIASDLTDPQADGWYVVED